MHHTKTKTFPRVCDLPYESLYFSSANESSKDSSKTWIEFMFWKNILLKKQFYNLKLDRLLPSGYWKVPTSYLSKLFFIILGSKVFPVLDAPSNKNPRFGGGGVGGGGGL